MEKIDEDLEFSDSKEEVDSGGFVSFGSAISGKNVSFTDRVVLEDMMNQGHKSTEHYVHFEDAGPGQVRDRPEERYNLHRNVVYPRYTKYPTVASIDEEDLLKSDDSDKNKKDSHYAAEVGDVERLSKMHRSVLNARDDQGWSPLMYAASTGQLAAIQLMQNNGANLQAMDTQGRTLLHIAASFGHEHVICWLLEVGFDINATDFYEMTPLHLAAASNQVSVTRLLILNGADITVEDDRNRTPLKVAQIAGHPEIIDLLRDTKTNHV